ncbi:hypothetical protein WJ23_19685 [Burkholderia lata]|nr:hypothetical protein WJ23_19685 [Burkholderia lata]
MRKTGFQIGQRQVVLDVPVHLDCHEFTLTGLITIMLRMAGQCEASSGINTTNASHTKEPLRSRFPFFQANL